MRLFVQNGILLKDFATAVNIISKFTILLNISKFYMGLQHVFLFDDIDISFRPKPFAYKCRLITFVNSFDRDHARQNVGSDLDSCCLTL